MGGGAATGSPGSPAEGVSGTDSGSPAGDGPGAEPAVFLAVFTVDAEPALRRAAHELLDTPLADTQRALAVRARPTMPTRTWPWPQPRPCAPASASTTIPPDPGRFDDDARARLRALVGVAAHPPAARIDAGRCLAAIGDQPSRRALDALRISACLATCAT